MIAPLRQIDPEVSGRQHRLGHVYRTIASKFLPQQFRPSRDLPPVTRWRAWLFAGWVAMVTVIYFVFMLT